MSSSYKKTIHKYIDTCDTSSGADVEKNEAILNYQYPHQAQLYLYRCDAVGYAVFSRYGVATGVATFVWTVS